MCQNYVRTYNFKCCMVLVRQKSTRMWQSTNFVGFSCSNLTVIERRRCNDYVAWLPWSLKVHSKIFQTPSQYVNLWNITVQVTQYNISNHLCWYFWNMNIFGKHFQSCHSEMRINILRNRLLHQSLYGSQKFEL